jgi:thymidylate synthase
MDLDKDFTIDERYQELLQTILDYGKEKKDRTGTGTKSIFGYTIRWDMTQGFPLLTTKKMPMKTIATELKWFLKGDTNIKYLVDNGCNIWNGDAYKNYASIECNPPHDHSLSKSEFIDKIKTDDEFAKKWGELGPIYGKQWRNWNGRDQIADLIHDLKVNPDSRRLMVNAWNVDKLSDMTLPPCHYGFQVYTTEMTLEERAEEWTLSIGKDISYAKRFSHKDLDERNVPRRKISLMWNQRSVDTFLGLPFNIASYALLLKLIAYDVNMVPDQLIGNLGDVHLYKNHIEQAKEQIERDPIMLPELEISNVDLVNGEFAYKLIGYESHKSIKAPLSN